MDSRRADGQTPPEPPRDHLDLIAAQWAKVWPDLGTEAMTLIGRLLRAARHCERELEHFLGQEELTMTEFNILAALRRASPSEPLTPARLSRSLIITSGGVVKRIDSLESAGLVRRRPHPTDGRGLVLELSPAGRKLIDRVLPAHVQNEERLLAGLGTTDRESLSSILRRLLISLEE